MITFEHGLRGWQDKKRKEIFLLIIETTPYILPNKIKLDIGIIILNYKLSLNIWYGVGNA
jgi:hypothetical protein